AVAHLREPMLRVVCLSAALAAPVPIVATFHKYSPGLGWYRPFGPLCRAAARRMTCLVAVSEAAYAHAARVIPGDYEIVPNGVDVGGLARLEGTRAGERVLFVGRPEPPKGLPVLIRAFAPLPGRARPAPGPGR